MTRATTRPKEEQAVPVPEKPRQAAKLPLVWRVVLTVWALAFATLTLYEVTTFAWKALRAMW